MGSGSQPARASRQDVIHILQELLEGPLKDAGSKEDVEAFVDLCCMSAIPRGSEDPKSFVRPMTDRFVETVKIHFCRLVENRVARQVAQFMFMEWCFRHGHLAEDWHWSWKSKNEGDLRYKELVPLQTLTGIPN